MTDNSRKKQSVIGTDSTSRSTRKSVRGDSQDRIFDEHDLSSLSKPEGMSISRTDEIRLDYDARSEKSRELDMVGMLRVTHAG